MQILKSLFDFLFSRTMLAVVGLVVLALVLWFVGPLLAVDGLRPLASVGVRVTLLVLMLAFAILALNSGPVSLVVVAALCLLVWHAGPRLSLGTAQPLQPAWVRAVVVGVILLVFAGYWLFRLWRMVRADPQVVARFFAGESGYDKDSPEVRTTLLEMSSRIRQAVAQLGNLRGTGGLRRVFEGKRHVYDLPWYLVVGSTGAGKTTALLGSGLQFPLAHKMARPPVHATAGAEGGTRHCDWYLGNEAVLIDTAGRYATQDFHRENDAAEWRGFLGLLRKHRPRAPINGAVVTLSVADLLGQDRAARVQHAAALRERLVELRQQLGIRFSVYVLVTKSDLLAGFPEYFQSLTSEGRAQPWGFSLPYGTRKRRRQKAESLLDAGDDSLHARLRTELGLLKIRLDLGVRLRLNEEFDTERRQSLLALSHELQALFKPLLEMLDEVFLDSRFDTTQHHSALRGVFFISGVQAVQPIPADTRTLMQRLKNSLAPPPPAEPLVAGQAKAPAATSQLDVSPEDSAGVADAMVPGAKQGAGPSEAVVATGADAVPAQGRDEIAESERVRGTQPFFLHDVLRKVIIPDAHLVRPNLRWEFRFRLMRWMGHALALVLFLWLAGGLTLSFENNRKYLATVNRQVEVLAAEVRTLFAQFKPAGVPDVLSGSQQLPGYPGLDLGSPPLTFRYGLYAVPPVLDAASETYAQLQDHTLLPAILRRMEFVLAQSVKERDDKRAYETLRVYKLLHDRERYAQGGARDVRDWVLKDWEGTGSAIDFGGRASMVGHVEALFSGDRPVQSASLPNEALVRQVQEFLNSNTSTQRVYERSKAVMTPLAPQEFTLVRAVGPQVGTVFSRAGGLPLEKGVPGLFTYDGYHELFSKRLSEFVGRALEEDAWVMGRAGSVRKDTLGAAEDSLKANPLVEEVRRQYLTDYAAHWEAFLDSIRTVSGGDPAGTSLGFDLNVLRQLAAPDSPLSRLARAAARETTLSRPLVARAPEEAGFLDKATEQLNKRARELGKNLGIRPEERMEKQVVDNRFAALREVVTGQPDLALGGSVGGAATAKPGLENISGLINEFYTVLVVADTALNTGSLPPGSAEVGARLKLEAGKLPAPFREVLTALAVSGADKVTQASADILKKQAQVQFDRIMGLLVQQVSEPCRRGVEGRYPFAAVAQDASVDDLSLVFASGGAVDDFFVKYLGPYVDTSVRPWRYKSQETALAAPGTEGGAATGAAPPPGATGPTLLGELLKLLQQGGPDLEAFYRARQLRELFFRDAAGKKFAWKLELKVLELDPSITDLVIDIDGQGMRYVHGPIQPLAATWPGPRGGSTAEVTANPRISASTSTLLGNGPWALFRLLDKGRVVSSAMSGRMSVEFLFDGRRALLEVNSGGQSNPLGSDLLKGFHCPGRPAMKAES